MDRVTEYLTQDGDGDYYLFAEIETEMSREVLVWRSGGPEKLGGATSTPSPTMINTRFSDLTHTWAEAARVDPEIETAIGPCTYWQGGNGPKGIAFDTVRALWAYIEWKRSEEPSAPDLSKPLTFVKVTSTMLEEGLHSTDLDMLVEDHHGKS